MEKFCERLETDVLVERKGGKVVVHCRFFHMIPKGPACKRVLFGRLGFPLPTGKSAAKTFFRLSGIAMFDFVRVNWGIGDVRPTWHCPLYHDE